MLFIDLLETENIDKLVYLDAFRNTTFKLFHQEAQIRDREALELHTRGKSNKN